MFVDDNFKNALKKYLSLKGITQKGFAHEMGITQMTVSRWMSGKTDRLGTEVWDKIRSYIEPYMTPAKPITASVPQGFVKKQIQPLESLTMDVELCSAGVASKTLLLSIENEKCLAFSVSCEMPQLPFFKGDVLIIEEITQPQKDELILLVQDEKVVIRWCDGNIDRRFYFTGDEQGTAIVHEEGSWDFAGKVIEIRSKNFKRSN